MPLTATQLLKRHPEVRQHQEGWRNFSDTAALVDCMDLVITVDTSVAHVAGALHRPVWMLLPCSADWRWGLGSRTTGWYPSARLFRQARPGAWNGVVSEVR